MNLIEKYLNERPEDFLFKEGMIGGDECVLIVPQNIKCKWTEDTLMFRSMIVRKYDCKIISRGFSKFFNWSEQPDLDKFPDGPFEVIEKIDGSLIVWGCHNGELIHRTRGTFNAETMQNGDEIHFLMDKYSEFVQLVWRNPEYSILTEWQTKTNVIVINQVDEPTLTLVGIIENKTGILLSQKMLNDVAVEYDMSRPVRYHYSTIAECVSDVDLWTGKEGVVLYSEDGQHLRKCKSDWYLSLHRLATGMTSIEHVLDVFLASPRSFSWQEFHDYVARTMDWEIAEKCKDHMIRICDAYLRFHKDECFINDVMDREVKLLFDRKSQALHIQRLFDGWFKSYAFLRLDNREPDDKFIKTAIQSYL